MENISRGPISLITTDRISATCIASSEASRRRVSQSVCIGNKSRCVIRHLDHVDHLSHFSNPLYTSEDKLPLIERSNATFYYNAAIPRANTNSPQNGELQTLQKQSERLVR